MSLAAPTPDEFRAWAYDPDAELGEPDGDLALHRPECLPLLVEAAADPGCPKAELCARILETYARRLVGWGRAEAYPALREAAARAAALLGPAADWAAYVERLLGYRERPGPVNRARAERMALDLLCGPVLDARFRALGRTDWVTLRVAEPDTHWEARDADSYPTWLYIHRATGAFQLVRAKPLPPEGVRRVR